MKRFGDQKLLMYHAFVSAKDAASSLASQALGSHKFLQLKALEALESRSSNLKIVNADHTWHRHQELTVNLSSNPQKRVACVVSSRVRISASIRIERGSTRILGATVPVAIGGSAECILLETAWPIMVRREEGLCHCANKASWPKSWLKQHTVEDPQ